ncbi:FecR family protein [Parapedobacter lycopersici]|uniref:FecR family protein n=1 Tax=Parapedobacter lycopersici TaxID=1864939 RepID=UPI00214D6ACB|nr:FecR family protein [Parapedobacter lycopersici]
MEKDAKKLLKKYNAGTCSEEEKAFVESWYVQWRGDGLNLSQEERALAKAEIWQQITKSRNTKRTYLFRLPYLAAIASVAFVLLTLGALLFFSKETTTAERQLYAGTDGHGVRDIQPGGNKALLTLADGRTVTLDEMAKGEITEVAGMVIRKTAEGQLVYEMDATDASPFSSDGSPRYNRIVTPRGGQYQIILPDQTKVWLNSASSLKYPIQFTASERRVVLTGEAYFEVSRQNTAAGKLVPFFVETDTQVIEVLGTHFNVSSYTDERSTKTTLLEGSVRISVNPANEEASHHSMILRPNQQSILTKGNLNVVDVDAAESIAWKEGYFNFKDASLEAVMRQLSRWYDVDVVYEGNIPKGTYTGKVYRNMSLSKVLDILTYAEVKFKIAGKTITILP